jgi:hypothetical protein
VRSVVRICYLVVLVIVSVVSVSGNANRIRHCVAIRYRTPLDSRQRVISSRNRKVPTGDLRVKIPYPFRYLTLSFSLYTIRYMNNDSLLGIAITLICLVVLLIGTL